MVCEVEPWKTSHIILSLHFMHGSRKFCQRGSNFDIFGVFLADDGREDPNTTISLAFRWLADDSPTVNAGLVAF